MWVLEGAETHNPFDPQFIVVYKIFPNILQYYTAEGWPSGLRHWLQEPASYDTGGSNPSPFSTVRDANWKA